MAKYIFMTLVVVKTATAFSTIQNDVPVRFYRILSLNSATVENPDVVNGQFHGTEEIEGVLKETDNDMGIFEVIARRAAICLFESDMRRDAKGKSPSVVASSATNWINDATAFSLQQSFDRIKLKVSLFQV